MRMNFIFIALLFFSQNAISEWGDDWGSMIWEEFILNNIDSDNDGISDENDNCPNVANLDCSMVNGQYTCIMPDIDSDGIGDACDNDSDNDGVEDNLDAFPLDPSETTDTDNDGIGDNADNDADNDGFTADFDSNDLNAYLSTDPDDDGVDSSGISHYSDSICLPPPGCNDTDPCITVCYVPPQDNCPLVSNADQSDLDGDTQGDACDRDIDGDGVFNTIENAFGTNPLDPSDGGEAELKALEASLLDEVVVPAMGGIGLLVLGLSMLGLGAVRLRK